jgi:hypothetical protein
LPMMRGVRRGWRRGQDPDEHGKALHGGPQ